MELKIKWENEEQVEEKIKMNMDNLGNVVREAMKEAADEVADFILFRGAEDIEEAGRFGSQWTDALHADVTETQRTVRVEASMQPQGPPVTFWRVFEYGATISAKNPTGYMTFPIDTGEGGDNAFRWVRVPEVTIPKKFHLEEIAKEEASHAGEVFERILDEKLDDLNG